MIQENWTEQKIYFQSYLQPKKLEQKQFACLYSKINLKQARYLHILPTERYRYIFNVWFSEQDYCHRGLRQCRVCWPCLKMTRLCAPIAILVQRHLSTCILTRIAKKILICISLGNIELFKLSTIWIMSSYIVVDFH